jgi:hypothetical protein
MSGTDYILGLLAIITGLAISDMVVSLHSLLINRRNVKWDWLALAAAAFVLLMIVGSWRVSYVAMQGMSIGPPIWVFLLVLAETVCVYLAARAALPDKSDVGTRIDLAAHYDFVDRYLWSAIAVFYGLFIIINVMGFWLIGKVGFPTILWPSLGGLALVVALVIWPTRNVHRIIVPILLVWLSIRLLPARLLAL